MSDSQHPWQWISTQPMKAAENMALDAALFEACGMMDAPLLRFYRWSEPAATFGYFQRYEEVARQTFCSPLVRRPTGGGLVEHLSDWTYSFVVPCANAWWGLNAKESYQRIHRWIQGSLRMLGTAADLAGCGLEGVAGKCFLKPECSDLLIAGKKVAGAAQRRNRTGLLIQGSVQLGGEGGDREDWERAMREEARQQWGVQWVEWKDFETFQGRQKELTRDLFGCETHQRRR